MIKRFSVHSSLAPLAAAVALIAFAPPGRAITLGQVDDFEDGTTMGWRGNAVLNIPDIGPMGVGDSAMRVDSFIRMVTVSDFAPTTDPTQWTGDYTTAGVTQISMDVQNPNLYDLQLYLGIADDTVTSNGGGATYVTDYFITIPADEAWHSVTFSIAADDFIESITNTETTPVGAAEILSDVFQLRILHTTIEGEFRGEDVIGHFFVDNISAESATAVEDADFDGDDDVDGEDFLIWQRGLGVGATQPAGDADGNGAVNALDLEIWREQFGMGAATTAVAAIPEPAAAGLAIFASALAPLVLRRRR